MSMFGYHYHGVFVYQTMHIVVISAQFKCSRSFAWYYHKMSKVNLRHHLRWTFIFEWCVALQALQKNRLKMEWHRSCVNWKENFLYIILPWQFWKASILFYQVLIFFTLKNKLEYYSKQTTTHGVFLEICYNITAVKTCNYMYVVDSS
jgi:hypothetical protein